MDYANLILPWLFHSAGHLSYGNQASGNARLDVKGLSEKWQGPIDAYRQPTNDDITKGKTRIAKDRQGFDNLVTPIYNKEAQSTFGGAGFSAQDKVGGLLNSPAYNISNALQKALYMAGMNKLSNAQEGDIKQMEHNSGNKMVPGLLALSILDDLRRAKNPDSNWNLDFTTIDGAPGLLFNKRF